ncbi:MAG: hypothetical protein HYR76_00480 [Ignavibacteria bacterium]|nr:hypothetical protein [Ignavibacteria bacterium]
METKDGTVWVTTSQGLAWYNGFQWNVVNGSHEIAKWNIHRLDVVSNDTVLIIAGDGLFISTKNSFHRLPLNEISDAVPFLEQGLMVAIWSDPIKPDRQLGCSV